MCIDGDMDFCVDGDFAFVLNCDRSWGPGCKRGPVGFCNRDRSKLPCSADGPGPRIPMPRERGYCPYCLLNKRGICTVLESLIILLYFLVF